MLDAQSAGYVKIWQRAGIHAMDWARALPGNSPAVVQGRIAQVGVLAAVVINAATKEPCCVAASRACGEILQRTRERLESVRASVNIIGLHVGV
jgi:hypothetical protein